MGKKLPKPEVILAGKVLTVFRDAGFDMLTPMSKAKKLRAVVKGTCGLTVIQRKELLGAIAICKGYASNGDYSDIKRALTRRRPSMAAFCAIQGKLRDKKIQLIEMVNYARPAKMG